MSKKEELRRINLRLKKEVKDLSLYKKEKVFVLGEGNLNAKVMLVGQNPGEEEKKLKRPFVGRSGKYLDGILDKNKISRKNLYITSVVNLRTPKNRKPNERETDFFMPYLVEKINVIKPKIVVLMGAIAWKTPSVKGIKYIRTYHPAAAMRFEKFRKKFKDDFKKLGVLIHRR